MLFFAFVHLFCRTRDSDLSHSLEFTAERPLFEPSLDGVCVNGCFPGPIQKVSIAAEGNLRGPNTYWRKLVERKG